MQLLLPQPQQAVLFVKKSGAINTQLSLGKSTQNFPSLPNFCVQLSEPNRIVLIGVVLVVRVAGREGAGICNCEIDHNLN